MNAERAELERFLCGEPDATCFPHREHVRMAFETRAAHLPAARPPAMSAVRILAACLQ